MSPRSALSACALALAVAAAALAGSAQAKDDTIVFVDGRTETGVQVTKETLEMVRVRGRGDLQARTVLRIVHGNPPTAFGQGEGALIAGRYSEAVDAFTRALSDTTDKEWVKPYAAFHKAEALRRWGKASGDKGKVGDAVSAYRAFVAESADHFLVPAARYGLADALLAQGDFGGAKGEFAEVGQRKYGDYWELRGKLGKGLCALQEKQYTEALTEIETTISAAKRPGFEEILITAQVAKGETYMAKQDFTQAIGFYEDLAKRGEGQSAQSAGEAYVNLAKAYEGRGKEDDKRKALRTYMQVTLYYAGAPEAYAEALYQTSRLLEAEGQKELAQAYVRELNGRCPDSSWAKKAR